jgi:broad specificity phosphatase PhoE
LTHIIIARHGQTEANRDDIVLGASDSPLTPRGIADVKNTAAMIAHENVGRVYCSPLGRAVVSATVFAEKWGLAPVIAPELRELSCGSWEGIPREALGKSRRPVREAWSDTPPGGESYADGAARLGPFMHMLAGLRPAGAVLVVAHASLNRVLLKMLLGMNEVEFLTLDFPHDAVHSILDDTVTVKWASGKIQRGLFRLSSHTP